MGNVKLTKLLLLAVSFLGLIRFSTAQDLTPQKPKRKAQFYFSWGYNRDWYSKSNIHVIYHNAQNTEQLNVMLYDAKAKDKPDMDRYWQPERLTIPQYDLKAGLFFNDKHDFGIELGWNHLKYVVTPWQNIHMKGEINGTPIDAVVPLNDTLIHIQHTNGNNYLILSLVKRQKLITRKNVQISAIATVGAGPMISYTIDKILGDYDPGYFHYHGWVAATSLGLRISFLKYLFIQTDAQGAFANYTNTKLGYAHLGTARQHFFSLQWTWEGGLIFPVGKKMVMAPK